MSATVTPPARPTAPICNETRLRMYDAVREAIAEQPELTSGAKTAGAVVAILDVAAVVGFTGAGIPVAGQGPLIDAWLQETLDSLGRIVHAAKQKAGSS